VFKINRIKKEAVKDQDMKKEAMKGSRTQNTKSQCRTEIFL